MKMEFLIKHGEYENVVCIYKIEQNHTGMVYIGSTNNLRKRMNYHIKKLTENTHRNTQLQNSWNSSNGNFHFEIVEIVNDETFLPFAELYYIEKYRRINGVYNISNPLEEEFLFKTRAKSKAKKEEKVISNPKAQKDIIKNTLIAEFKYLFDALKQKINDSHQVAFSKIKDYIVGKTSLNVDAKEIENNIIRILKSYDLTVLNFESPFYDRGILNTYEIPYERSIISKELAKKITGEIHNI